MAAATVVPRYIHDSALNLHILATGFPAPAATELVNYRLASPPNRVLRATVNGIALVLGGVALYATLNAVPYQAIFQWAESLYVEDAPFVAPQSITRPAPVRPVAAQEYAPTESEAANAIPLPPYQDPLATQPATLPALAAPSRPTAPAPFVAAPPAAPLAAIEAPAAAATANFNPPKRAAVGDIQAPALAAVTPAKETIVVARQPASAAKKVAAPKVSLPPVPVKTITSSRTTTPSAQTQVVRVVNPGSGTSQGQPMYMVPSADGKSYTLAPPAAGMPVFVGGEAQPMVVQPAPIQRETILIK